MPLFMDVHSIDGGVSAADVAKAHKADLATQDAHGVDYRHYWVDEKAGKIFCLVEAPTLTPRTQCTERRTGWWPTRSSRSPSTDAAAAALDGGERRRVDAAWRTSRHRPGW